VVNLPTSVRIGFDADPCWRVSCPGSGIAVW